jgi:hypothetical protein
VAPPPGGRHDRLGAGCQRPVRALPSGHARAWVPVPSGAGAAPDGGRRPARRPGHPARAAPAVHRERGAGQARHPFPQHRRAGRAADPRPDGAAGLAPACPRCCPGRDRPGRPGPHGPRLPADLGRVRRADRSLHGGRPPPLAPVGAGRGPGRGWPGRLRGHRHAPPPPEPARGDRAGLGGHLRAVRGRLVPRQRAAQAPGLHGQAGGAQRPAGPGSGAALALGGGRGAGPDRPGAARRGRPLGECDGGAGRGGPAQRRHQPGPGHHRSGPDRVDRPAGPDRAAPAARAAARRRGARRRPGSPAQPRPPRVAGGGGPRGWPAGRGRRRGRAWPAAGRGGPVRLPDRPGGADQLAQARGPGQGQRAHLLRPRGARGPGLGRRDRQERPTRRGRARAHRHARAGSPVRRLAGGRGPPRRRLPGGRPPPGVRGVRGSHA